MYDESDRTTVMPRYAPEPSVTDWQPASAPRPSSPLWTAMTACVALAVLAACTIIAFGAGRTHARSEPVPTITHTVTQTKTATATVTVTPRAQRSGDSLLDKLDHVLSR